MACVWGRSCLVSAWATLSMSWNGCWKEAPLSRSRSCQLDQEKGNCFFLQRPLEMGNCPIGICLTHTRVCTKKPNYFLPTSACQPQQPNGANSKYFPFPQKFNQAAKRNKRKTSTWKNLFESFSCNLQLSASRLHMLLKLSCSQVRDYSLPWEFCSTAAWALTSKWLWSPALFDKGVKSLSPSSSIIQHVQGRKKSWEHWYAVKAQLTVVWRMSLMHRDWLRIHVQYLQVSVCRTQWNAKCSRFLLIQMILRQVLTEHASVLPFCSLLAEFTKCGLQSGWG